MIDSWDTRQQGVKWNIFNAFNCSPSFIGGSRTQVQSPPRLAKNQIWDQYTMGSQMRGASSQRERELAIALSVAKMRNCLARCGIRFYQDSPSRICLFQDFCSSDNCYHYVFRTVKNEALSQTHTAVL